MLWREIKPGRAMVASQLEVAVSVPNEHQHTSGAKRLSSLTFS